MNDFEPGIKKERKERCDVFFFFIIKCWRVAFVSLRQVKGYTDRLQGMKKIVRRRKRQRLGTHALRKRVYIIVLIFETVF